MLVVFLYLEKNLWIPMSRDTGIIFLAPSTFTDILLTSKDCFVRFLSGLHWDPDKSHGGKLYTISHSRQTWSEARDSCARDGGSLAVVLSAATQEYLAETFIDSSEP